MHEADEAAVDWLTACGSQHTIIIIIIIIIMWKLCRGEQCKYDFCWVCLEPWKKHSTATGGYFRCNRYEVVRKVEEQQDLLKTEVIN